MAAHKARRKSLEEEDLAAAVADMIQSPITQANLSFLNAKVASDRSVSPAGEQQAGNPGNPATSRNTSPSDQSMEETTIVDSSTVAESKAHDSRPTTLELTTALSSVVHKTIVRETPEPSTIAESTIVVSPDYPAYQLPAPSLPKVHLCRTVQDGHSPSEQGLYMMLWSIGTPIREDARLVQVSLSKLAPKSGMTIKNLQMMLRRLEEKKTIALVKPFSHATKSANVYHVYSYKAILQRRKDAGLEYVIRNKGVQFLKTEEAIGILKAREEEDNRLFRGVTMEQPTIVDFKTTIEETSVSTIVKTDKTTIVDSAHIIEQEVKEQTTTATDTSAIVRLLRQELGHVDAAAVRRLVDECRKRAPDATDAEITHFISQKLAATLRTTVRNPVGFLLSTVPGCFEGEPFRQFRDEARQQRQREEAERATLEAEATRYRAVLEDPAASDDQKREARWYLGLTSEMPW